jgi:hypothetical protein
MFIFVKLDWYNSSYAQGLNDILNFIECEHFKMGHMKHTCPNPHSGENLHSQPREGAIFDIVNKTGMWVTAIEYDTMSYFNDDSKIELKSYQLGPEILEKFAGYIAGMPYGI